MRPLGALCLVCTLAWVSKLNAADHAFKDVVHAISIELHTPPVHIPLFGLVNVVTFVVRPAGTKHIDLAVFENLDDRDRDGRNIPAAIRHAVPGEWKPFVQVISNRAGREETTLMYMRPEGKDLKILIATVEPNEATVVQLQLNPTALERWLKNPRESILHHAHETN